MMPVTKTAQTAARRISSRPAPRQINHQRLRARLADLGCNLPPRTLRFLEEHFQDRQIIPLIGQLWLATRGNDIKMGKLAKPIPELIKKGRSLADIRRDIATATKWSGAPEFYAVDALPFLWSENYSSDTINNYLRNIQQITKNREKPEAYEEALQLLVCALRAGLNSLQAFHLIKTVQDKFRADALKAFRHVRQHPEKLKENNAHIILAASLKPRDLD